VKTPPLLRPGAYRTLLAGQAVSALGDWMGTFAFIALVYQQSGSPTAVGGILALRLLPAALGGPLAARAASRWDRRRTMVAMDVLRAGMIAVVPLIRGLWWVYLWAFMVEVGSLVFLPARDASIPELVDADDLQLANGFVLGSSYGTIPIGAAVYALIAALPGSSPFGRPLAVVFWLDALAQ
jgi:MFS family permease